MVREERSGNLERMKVVSVDSAAQIIGVSSATIRNWVKAGQICPISTRPLSFVEQAIFDLKAQISCNSVGKLKARANKVASSNIVVPDEYITNTEFNLQISELLNLSKERPLNIQDAMFHAAMYILESRDEVTSARGGERRVAFDSQRVWRRNSVKEVMFRWSTSSNIGERLPWYVELYEMFSRQEEDDYLGLLYQSLSSVGIKSEHGSYFTPTKLVQEALEHLPKPIRTFLDPCCGTGKYLINAARKFALEPQNVLGFDVDPIATNIAKVNVLLAYGNDEFIPNVHCMDTLSEVATGEMFCKTNHLIDSIDAIATNPPWGAYKNMTTKSQLSRHVTSGETFSLFLEKSIRLLRDGGGLSFILPESILTIKTHADIRSLVLRETTITMISVLGRRFTGVYTPVIRLDLVKKRFNDALITVENDGGQYRVSQERFQRNENQAFDVHVRTDEVALLECIYSVDHTTLVGSAEWALGIVTGDNKKHLLDQLEAGAEPIFRGSDVQPFYLEAPRSYIHFSPARYQQVANERYYRASEKLLYKFISKRLVFAYDDQRQLSLNSANILIPSIPGMSIKVVLAFLNSQVFQYIFSKKFSTHKVLRGDLEKLPFPRISKDVHDRMERLVDAAIANREVPDELHDLVFTSFGLDRKSTAFIANSVQG